MKTYSKPTNEQVKATATKLFAPSHARYFFNKLENPHWIAPLAACDLFKWPPEPEKTGGGAIRCAIWPQSKYLVRMASLAPEAVAEVFASVRTQNWIVLHDMVEAAGKMPGGIAARMVQPICEGLGSEMAWHQLGEVGKLIAHLANEGATSAALSVFQAAFNLDTAAVARLTNDSDSYYYFEALDKDIIPALVRQVPAQLVAHLIRWLQAACDHEEGRPGTKGNYSYLWRPAIEDHEQNKDYELAAKITGRLRRVLESAIASKALSLKEALNEIEAVPAQVALRMKIHLIAEYAESDVVLALATMMDHDLFGDLATKHEYSRLMRLRWPMLGTKEQSRWLGWVDEGPEGVHADYYDQPHDKERSEKQRKYWQFQRLYWIRDHLIDERRQFVEDMVNQHGIPELADLNVFSNGISWGFKSAFEVSQFEALGFEKALEVAVAWRPAPDQQRFDSPSMDGALATFSEFTRKNLPENSTHAALLEGKPVQFVRAFLAAMEDGVKKDEPISLSPVLKLARWVLSRPIDEQAALKLERGLEEPGWQYTRDTIASLVEAVSLARDSNGRPRFGLEYRPDLWAVASVLPECPSVNYVSIDSGKDPRFADWTLLALNSTRGKAIRAVLAHADWVSVHLDVDRANSPEFPGGLDKLPEIRDCLEKQIQRPDADAAGFAALGYRFAFLRWLDPQWLRRWATNLFDLRAIEKDSAAVHGWAAWSAFLFTTRPHRVYYELLREQFDYAVDHAVKQTKLTDVRDKIMGNLAQHLIVLFGRGDLGASIDQALKTDNEIIVRLVTKTPVALRSHAMQIVGSTLFGSKEKLPVDVLKRFTALWDVYWKKAGAQDASSDPRSAVFGYWFSSGAFPDDWSIARLLEVARLVPQLEPDDLVVERLARICEVDPVGSAQVVELLVRGDTEGWRVSSWKEDAHRILLIAVKAGGKARQIAETTIDRLGRRGFLEFESILG